MTSVAQLLKNKSTNVWTVTPTTSVFEALELMAKKDIGAVPVVKDDKLVGMLSERDYARKVIPQGRTSKTTAVSELMTSKVYFVRPDQTVEDCMALMTEKRIRHLPVLDGEKLVGIVTIGDLVKSVITAQEITIRSLQNYITGAYEA